MRRFRAVRRAGPTLGLALFPCLPASAPPLCPSPQAAPPPAAAVPGGVAVPGPHSGAFVPNLGQWATRALYVARMGPSTVQVEERGWMVSVVEEPGGEEETRPVRGAAVRMRFAGSDPAGTPRPQGRLPGHRSFFPGGDPSRWRGRVPAYGRLLYEGMYPGVDVLLREVGGSLEYDLLVAPGADLSQVVVEVEGGQGLWIDEEGALVVETTLGPLVQPPPATWQEDGGGRRVPVACRYVLLGKDRFGFAAPDRDPAWRLVVDPGLVWSTFLGGSGSERAWAVAVDAAGALTVAGTTSFGGFPTTPGAFQGAGAGLASAFVARLAPGGDALVWSTHLGGTGRDVAFGVAVDGTGAATVAGQTDSTDFPTTPGAFQTGFGGGGMDAFVTRLAPGGDALVWSTYLGGSDWDAATAVALDAAGAVAVAGGTQSGNFPTTPGAFQRTHGGGGDDAFVARLAPGGDTLAWSTYLGGGGRDWAYGLALDGTGAATVVGETFSSDFPTTPGAFQGNRRGGGDAFAARLAPGGDALVWSTYLGGTDADRAEGVAVDMTGAATVVGGTFSSDFPTTPGAFQTTHGGTEDAFVARLAPGGDALAWSTFLGGTGRDLAFAVAVDAAAAAVVVGETASAGFPTTPGAFQRTRGGGISDAFATRVAPGGDALLWSSFLGGSGEDGAFGVALDPLGDAAVVGGTRSMGFPTTPGSLQPGHAGGLDAFAARLDMLPAGASRFGRPSPGCAGPLAIGVSSSPQAGNAAFAATCAGAPPSATGLLGLALGGLAGPLQVLGIEVWLDPLPLLLTVPAASNPLGASTVPLPLPNDPALVGGRVFLQFFWAGPTAPLPCPPLGVSASPGLRVTVQA